MKPPIYVKKPRSKIKLFLGSNLFLFGFLVIFILIYYSGDPIQIIEALLFSYLCLVILVCFLLPFANLILLSFGIDFYDMILGIMGMQGDLFTQTFMITTVITYIITCYSIIIVTTIIAIEFALNPQKFNEFWRKLEIISLYKPSKKT
jgi:uncharacterized membrane protein YhhN